MKTEKAAKKQASKAAPKRKSYQTPNVVFVGEAVDLVQGRTHGKYGDAYSGYYWEG